MAGRRDGGAASPGPRLRPGGPRRPYTPVSVSDLPLQLGADLAGRLATALDVEGKIVRGIEALGPIAGRDVLLVDGAASPLVAGMEAVGTRVRHHAVPA